MKPPTGEELQAACDAITDDGPGSPITAELGLLTIKNPLLREYVRQAQEVLKQLNLIRRPDLPVLDAVVTGALMYGLNLGLRVGEARATREKEEAGGVNRSVN